MPICASGRGGGINNKGTEADLQFLRSAAEKAVRRNYVQNQWQLPQEALFVTPCILLAYLLIVLPAHVILQGMQMCGLIG